MCGDLLGRLSLSNIAESLLVKLSLHLILNTLFCRES